MSTARADWQAWSTTVDLLVTDPSALGPARRLVQDRMAAVDLACSRFRPDSEVQRLRGTGGGTVSPVLASLVAAALEASRLTDGDVDPTVGVAMEDLGYDRDIRVLRAVTATGPEGPDVRVEVVRYGPVPGWRSVHLDGLRLTTPVGCLLDLGATAKAATADWCATAIARTCGTGVLVGLGGDVATAGPSPAGGWQVRVQDADTDPAAQVRLAGGHAVATSSTTSRTWRHAGRVMHHLLDPRTAQPAHAVWRSATVSAPTCMVANALSTAALVRGVDAVAWLRGRGAPARLVAADGSVQPVAGWPADAELVAA